VVDVFNTLDWDRTDLVVLDEASSRAGDRVVEEGGGAVPSQRLSTGELAFLARGVPALGSRSYTVVQGDAEEPEGAGEGLPDLDPRIDLVLVETSHLALGVDPRSGVIRSLTHLPSGKELVRQGSGGVNQYLYVPGRHPSEAVSTGPARVRIKEEGPLVWSIESVSPGPGLREPLVSEYRLTQGLPRVDLINLLAKEWVTDPEAVLFAFPFELDDPEVWIDAPFGPFRPEMDQLPGASKNYFTTQRWVDLSEPEIGVTVANLDAPLIQLGEIRTDPIAYGWLESIRPSATLFSYVMNNYWETNYRAAQDDEVALRYSLGVHGVYEAEETRRFGLETARPFVVRVRGG
jgi:alpha-mannosidase